MLGTETGNPETHDISLNVEQLDSCCIFKYNLFFMYRQPTISSC